jgi:hypothetical protein
MPVQGVNAEKLQQRLHSDRSATIYVTDVPPTSPQFAAVQWWGTRGGLHGLVPSNQPKPKSLGGQYSAAFPGHSAELKEPLDEATYRRWQTVGVAPAEQAIPKLTRGEFITRAWQTRKQSGQ